MFVEYNIWFDISGLAILFVITLLYILKNSVEDNTSLMFRLTLAFCFISTAADLWYGLWMNGTTRLMTSPLFANDMTSYLYFLAHLSCAFIFLHYIREALGIHFSRSVTIISTLPFIICVSILLLNPIHRWVYSIDAEGFYQRGDGLYLLYGCAIGYMVAGMMLLFRYGKRMIAGRFYALLTFIIMSFVGIGIQAAVPSLLVENYFVDLCLLFVYLSMYRPEDITDETTQLLNERAFRILTSTLITRHKRFSLVFLHLEDASYILSLLSEASTSALRSSIAEFLSKTFRRAELFHLGIGLFCLLYQDQGEMQEEGVVEQLTHRFSHSWQASGEPIKFTSRIVSFVCPDDAATLEDFVDVRSALLHAKPFQTVVDVKGLDVATERRNRMIDHISRICVENGLLEVVFQPVWDIHRQSFRTAEALVRLKDPQLGRISPEELVAVAERNGTIQKIDSFVLDRVCAFLTQHGDHVENINVNLSMVECVQTTLVERINTTITQWKVRPEQLHFEVTETVSNRFPDVARRNIQTLTAQGFVFCLDDFGQGYSNLDRLISLPFGIIKLDKQFIVGDGWVNNLLVSMAEVIISMDKQILVEGVETEEQAKRAISLGADFIQGYYYAKPMPQAEYLDFLKTL